MSWRDKLKWGDESLKTPEHDALMLWLNENCVTVAQSLFPKLVANRFGSIEWEKPLCSMNGSILCFIDLYMEGVEQVRLDYFPIHSLLFEVKPKIESIGEVLRQLKSYEHYSSIGDSSSFHYKKSHIILVSPDNKAKDIVLQNGFMFLNPDEFDIDEPTRRKEDK